MLTVRGTYTNGIVQPLEPVEGREGQQVVITFVEDTMTVEEADRRLKECIIDLGHASGTDNEDIDADLASEYGNNHVS